MKLQSFLMTTFFAESVNKQNSNVKKNVDNENKLDNFARTIKSLKLIPMQTMLAELNVDNPDL